MFEVSRDAWGVPHLRARTHEELAYAQGHNAATDRPRQLTHERARSRGETAVDHGVEAVAWDRFARQARLDNTAHRCWTNLDDATAHWVAAYVDGVNAVLPNRWDPWTPIAIWVSHHVLFAGFPSKLWRDEVANRLGKHLTDLFATDGHTSLGSNGWLIDGSRTASGRALLAGDPHRFLEDPGIYQQVRLTCEEYDVVGLAVPGVPGIAHFGHTGQVAWAITNAMADYQDLYREQLRHTPDGIQALGPHGWEPVLAQVETIEVAGAEPMAVEVLETSRGPMILDKISLRCPVRVLEECGFATLPLLLRARTVADIDAALDLWVEPVNVVQAADVDGGLLHRVAGRVPLRDGGSRVQPVHNTWQGWAPMPRADVTGIAVMANERGLAAPLGVEFAPRHRADRIRSLLEQGHDWKPEQMQAVHTDTLLPSALPLLALLHDLELSPAASSLRDELLGWDLHMDADSTIAARFAALRHAVVLLLAAHRALAPLAEIPSYPSVFQPWLDLVPRVGFSLEHLLTHPLFPTQDVGAIVAAALEQVARTTTASWGELHRIAPWQVDSRPEQWPGVAGDHDCVLATSSVPGVTDRCARGPAARFVWDLADRDGSLWIVPFGASELPSSPHHRDQLPLWLAGTLVPVGDALTKENDVR